MYADKLFKKKLQFIRMILTHLLFIPGLLFLIVGFVYGRKPASPEGGILAVCFAINIIIYMSIIGLLIRISLFESWSIQILGYLVLYCDTVVSQVIGISIVYGIFKSIEFNIMTFLYGSSVFHIGMGIIIIIGLIIVKILKNCWNNFDQNSPKEIINNKPYPENKPELVNNHDPNSVKINMVPGNNPGQGTGQGPCQGPGVNPLLTMLPLNGSNGETMIYHLNSLQHGTNSGLTRWNDPFLNILQGNNSGLARWTSPI